MKLLEQKILKFECFAKQLDDKSLTNYKIEQASLDNLKSILSPNEMKDDPGLMYFYGELFNSDLSNKNGSIISLLNTIKCYKSFEQKMIDVEHITNDIAGYILKSFLTDPETKEIITEETAMINKKPVNVSIAFIVWPRANPGLAQILEEVGQTDNPSHGLISLSLELGYNEYNLLVGGDSFSTGTLITSEEEITELESNLLENGGTGYIINTDKKVSKVLEGDLIGLAAGLVVKPAAHVNGVIKLKQDNVEKEDVKIIGKQEIEENLIKKIDNLDVKLSIITQELNDKISNINNFFEKDGSHSICSTVLLSNTIMKKINSVTDINDEVLASKEVTATEITRFIAEQLDVKCEEHKQVVAAKDAEITEIKSNTDAALSKVNELTVSLEAVTTELNELKAAQLAAKAEADFNTRMAALSEEFDLDDEDRSVIVAQIRDLNEESFAGWKKSFDVIAKQKKKALKGEKPGDKVNDKEPDKDADDKKFVKASVKEKDETVDPLELVQAKLKDVVPGTVSFSEDKLAAFREAFKPENCIVASKR